MVALARGDHNRMFISGVFQPACMTASLAFGQGEEEASWDSDSYVSKKKSIALWLYQDAVLYKLFERMKMLRVDGPTLTENKTLVLFRRTPRDTRRPG